MAKIFMKAIKNIDNYSASMIEQLQNEVKTLSNDINSRGFFLMDKKDLIYLLKEDVYE
jgi:hypothetical protein